MLHSFENNTFQALGKTVRGASKNLETFPAPPFVDEVIMTSHEFTSVCPITGQPDFGTVEIRYRPNMKCLESKSLKLYLMTFREKGTFCEALASEIAQDVITALKAKSVSVSVVQTPRGGVGITSNAWVKEGMMIPFPTVVEAVKPVSLVMGGDTLAMD